MSNAKRTTVILSDESRKFLRGIPRGFRSPFLDALILEASERFTNSEEIAQFVMQHPNLFFKNLHAKESKIDVKGKKKKPQPAGKKEGKQEEHGKGDVSKLDKMEGFF